MSIILKIQRQRDWRSRLLDWAISVINKPYEWGATDCGSLARAALIEMFGEEAAPFLPAPWSSAREALLLLKREGSVGHQLEQLGADVMTLPFLRAGDIVISREEEEEVGRVAVMVCIDCRTCIASTKDGVAWSAPEPNGVPYSLWEMVIHG